MSKCVLDIEYRVYKNTPTLNKSGLAPYIPSLIWC